MDPHNLPDIEIFRHSAPVQLRFNDVDVLGHVNNTVYFSFYDTGKACYFNDVNGRPTDWKHVDTVIANVDCAYLAPIVFGEEIEVLTACTAIHDKSFRMLQMIREKNTGQPKSVCETVMVCFDPATGKTRAVDDVWRKAVENFEGRKLSDLPA